MGRRRALVSFRLRSTVMARMEGQILAVLLFLALASEAAATKYVVGFWMHFTDSTPVFGSVLEGGDAVSHFGNGIVFDYPITGGVTVDTPLLGNARGFYVANSNTQGSETFLEDFTVSFTALSQYSSSSLQIAGLWNEADSVHELPVTGGTGYFRFARGYALIEPVPQSETDTHFVRITLDIPY